MIEYQNQNKEVPILVTGAHRSGTTWVGKMLAAGNQLAYISEPLNRWHRPGVMRAPVRYWYPYICADNEEDFLPALQETTSFRYHPWLELLSLRSMKDVLRMGRDSSIFIQGRIFRRRALLKDPFAIFSAPWFAGRIGCRVVIVLRHPAAFVSSLVRLGWSFDFCDLLAQPLLMRDLLSVFQRDMVELLDKPEDVIAQGSLLWRIVYSVVHQFEKRYPEFYVLRHEDLSLNPVDQFASLYSELGIDFTPKAQKKILNASSPRNPKEVSKRSVYAVQLDSRASIKNWQHRLTPQEVSRVRTLTADVAPIYYSEEDWE